MNNDLNDCEFDLELKWKVAVDAAAVDAAAVDAAAVVVAADTDTGDVGLAVDEVVYLLLVVGSKPV